MAAKQLAARLRCLEAQAQDTNAPLGEGLSGLLRSMDRGKDVDTVPVGALSDAELETQIATLASARGLVLLLRELQEDERTRRQAAYTKEPHT